MTEKKYPVRRALIPAVVLLMVVVGLYLMTFFTIPYQ